MGMSPGGWIAFGVDLGENHPFYHDLDVDARWETMDKADEDGIELEEISQYIEHRYSTILKDFPVSLLRYGYYDEDQFFLMIPGTYFEAVRWGCSPVPFTIKEHMYEGLDSQIKAAKAFCAQYGLPPFDNCGWFVGCHYG